MLSLDVDPPHLLAGDFLLVLDGIDDTRDGCAGKAEEEYFLTRPQVALGNLRGLQDGDGRLAGTRPSGDEEVPLGRQDLTLFLSQLNPHRHPARHPPRPERTERPTRPQKSEPAYTWVSTQSKRADATTVLPARSPEVE